MLLWLPARLRKSWEQKFPGPSRNQPYHRARLNGLAVELRHERIAKITLAAGARDGPALTGRDAVSAYGIGTGRAAKLTYSPAGSGSSVCEARDNIGITYSCIVHE
jgi:hypothetical protein